MLIAQITDTHIVEKGQSWLSQPATQTAERLARVVAYINELKPLPDVVLLTGDATDTGTKEAYAHLKELLAPLKAPLYILPGNHDCREEMRAAFSKMPYMPSHGFLHYAIEEYPVRLIGLDTHVEGKDYGRICDERFTWLKEKLREELQKPTLIFMHHPPVHTGTKLFDSITCFTPPDFGHLIGSQKELLAIVSGHYHHLCMSSLEGKPCFIAPSVAPVHYFAHPQEDDFVSALELEDPALVLHRWESGKPLVTHVKRIKEQFQRIDWSLIK